MTKEEREAFIKDGPGAFSKEYLWNALMTCFKIIESFEKFIERNSERSE